ncbi:armadillo-type protein [Mycotypha africana]|uniref:armadillo-type protein n=1 Tax=Mycotypha africana TaxID=64632 RepID=UPI002300958D|nr:armadillo-type protein [Mycotypha africana]KAI8975066.1 armadillo-type protein [Mycotypha africana]
MTIDVFEPDAELLEISRKMSNVSIHRKPTSDGDSSIKLESLSTMKYILTTTCDNDKIYKSARNIRKYLTQGHSDEKSVNDILELNILSTIKELLQKSFSNTDIKFECAWIITNIAAGTTEQTEAIVNAGLVDALLNCLRDSYASLDLKAQVAWALGNIAGESPRYREELMNRQFTQLMVEILTDIFDQTFDDSLDNISYHQSVFRFPDEEYYANVESLLWALSNMCRGGFCVAEHYSSYLPVFEILSKYIKFDYPKFEAEVCWGLSRILYNMHNVREFHQHNEITPELCERLANMLEYKQPKVIVPALRTVVNITSGPNDCIYGLLKTNLLSSLTRLLDPMIPNEIRKDAYLIIGNLAAGPEDMIRHVIEHKLVLINVVNHICVPGHIYNEVSYSWEPTLTHAYYQKNDEWKVTKEALWIVFNIISLGSDATVSQFIQEFPTVHIKLAALLHYFNAPLQVCEKTVEGIISLIQRSNKLVGEHFEGCKNRFVQELIEAGVHKIIPAVQNAHHHDGLKDLCSKLDNLLRASEEDLSKTLTDICGMASAFGLPTIKEIQSKGNKRRVLRGLEDGDVRLIENAVGNLCI